MSPMPLHNLLTDRQAHAGTRILFFGMQALEHLKDALGMLRVNTNPIIPDGEDPYPIPLLSRDMDAWRLLITK